MSVDLAATTWGSPKLSAVLLIHGPACCGGTWAPIAERLADQYHLIAPDLRGHGDSPRQDSYQFEEFIGDLDAYANARGLQRFAIIGHSMGGLLAMAYAIRYPERVSSLVSIDFSVPVPQWQVDYAQRACLNPVRTFTTEAEGLAYLRRAFSRTASDETLRQLASGVLGQIDSGWRFKVDPGALREFTDFPRAPEIERVRCRTLLFRGSDSRVMDRGGGIAMLRRIARARLVQIPRAGHYVHLDNPAATADELRRFLEEVPD